jgi:hypothetical protein
MNCAEFEVLLHALIDSELARRRARPRGGPKPRDNWILLFSDQFSARDSPTAAAIFDVSLADMEGAAVRGQFREVT